MTAIRRILVGEMDTERVAAYLPDNFKVIGSTPEGDTIVEGVDKMGWTVDDYVLPRLLSGLIYAKEVPVTVVHKYGCDGASSPSKPDCVCPIEPYSP